IDECLGKPCDVNARCNNSEGSFDCQCNVGYCGNGLICSRLPDTFISMTFTLKDREFTNSLHDPNSEDYQTLSREVKNNFDEEFANVPEYRGVNIIRFRSGSVICDAEVVLVLNAHDEITKVLERVNATGVLGNIFVVSDSLTTADIPEFRDIQLDVEYNGYAGDLLKITCNVTGPSLPSFEWRKNNMILSLSTRVKIENNDQVSKLFVRKTAKSDSGDYYCIASKGVDIINRSVAVQVKVIPVVAVFPLSVAATEGHTITLTCEVSVGNEGFIEILWYNSKQAGIVGQTRQLSLSNIELSDSDQSYKAEYWCLAKNSDGTGRSQNVPVYILSSDFNEFCIEVYDSGYTWEEIPVGTSVIKHCPNGTIGTVTQFCNSNDGQSVWGDVNFSNCRSSVVIKLVDKIFRLNEGFESGNISEILRETEKVSEDDELYEKDIEDIVYVLEKTEHKTKTQTDRLSFIRSSSNIVSQKKKNVWKNIPSRNHLAKQIISGTDLNAWNYISESAEIGNVVSYITPNIAVHGIRLPTAKPTKPGDIILLDTGGQGVIIPDVVTNELKQATVVQYSSIKDIFSEEELKESVDNTIGSTESLTIRSTIVSFTIEPSLKNKPVSKPFKIVLQNNQTGYENPRRTCAFIEPDINSSVWSSKGCTLNEAESSEENVTCDCDHNTAFAIMMDVTGVQLTESERKLLETISTVGCSISLVGVVLTILLQVYFWRQLKSPRAKILVSLCVAIGFTDIFAILEGVARDSPNFCKAVAALLHFFVLSAFGWMLCEGILLHILLIRVFDGVRGKHWKIFNFIGWGIPLLIVVVSLGATQGEGYGTESSCWLSVENNLIWAFVGPAFLVILINTIVFIMILRTIMNSHNTVHQPDNIGKVKTGVKTAVAIFPILGLTWVFGLMTFNRETLFFRYLFAVFNSAQGMLIFLFHCVLNKQTREVVRDSITRSTFSSSFSTKSVRRAKNSTSLPSMAVSSSINQKMVKKNARLQLESRESESAGYEGYNNLNMSVTREANEDDVYVTSPAVQGNEEMRHSSPNLSAHSENSLGRDNIAVETDSKGYHSGESENSSSEDRPSNNEEAHLTV
ncbi:Brain-specific angiogenesis inhibitor 3, partial [Paramuricea clavata]